MSLELEGNILTERTPARRWVAIIAIVIPVAALVMASAWFIRAFVAPPTIAISSPLILAAAPPMAPIETPSVAVKQSRPQQQPVEVVAVSPAPAPSASAIKEAAEPVTGVSALPMFATLAAAPPSLSGAQPAFAPPPRDPIHDPAPASVVAAEPVVEAEASEPIAGPVPLPRVKPRGPVALAASAIPLPRPRPADAEPPTDAATVFERHHAE